MEARRAARRAGVAGRRLTFAAGGPAAAGGPDEGGPDEGGPDEGGPDEGGARPGTGGDAGAGAGPAPWDRAKGQACAVRQPSA
jgi:hypothetical protein